ncbi:MAG: lipopolysaccharide biosynthesis protein [Marinospirillum sp.]|uniref:lipopolysaccharide biosynthesis protein n=1 Tax=Marinospirillum sp. TaxID=2183934 RepID=UPI0019EB98A1|nr:lipopolysaccharide biosynthesis protein [Marinospirillum sp.]MBE0508068.1 lipopolysaccharide biosynthesis protein [Marinospirillum sp.]
MSLTAKTTIGILWNFSEQLLRRGVGLVTTLLLAYFLAPEAYGLVAMMAVFIAIATSLMDSGFRQALIRLKEATDLDLSTAFYANLTLGLFAYTALYFAAPLIATFYEEQRLVLLIRVTGLVVLVNAFQVVQIALFHRQMNFKAQLKASFPAALASAVVAVLLAYKGAGVWALVAQMITAALITVILLWLMSEWRPKWCFSKSSLKSMYNFGYKLFLSGFLDIVFKNLYVVVIAKLFSASVAGLYFFAEKMRELILSQLVGAIQNVTYPALASVQDDNVRLKAGYRKVIAVTTFLLFPALMLLAALAEPLFQFLLPEKWWGAAPYLQLLCISGLLYPLHAINLNILKVKGRSDLFLYLEILKKIMVVAVIFVSYRYGVIGILIGQIVTSVLAYLPNSYFAARLINYPAREQIKDFVPGLLLSMLLGGLVYTAVQILDWPAFTLLALLGTSGLVAYLLGAHLMKLQAYTLAREMIQTKLKPKAL